MHELQASPVTPVVARSPQVHPHNVPQRPRSRPCSATTCFRGAQWQSGEACGLSMRPACSCTRRSRTLPTKGARGCAVKGGTLHGQLARHAAPHATASFGTWAALGGADPLLLLPALHPGSFS